MASDTRIKKYRKKIVAGNWKMNKTVADAVDLAESICRELAKFRDVDVILCPTFTALKAVGEAIDNSSIKLGAQNMHWEASGAYTGEISAGMLRDLYCHYVILGHSERRNYFQETDETVNKKVKAALAATLNVIMCVGETREEREAGKTEDVIKRQIEGGLKGVELDGGELILAYEPVWAIGTGLTATPDQAQAVHAFIRKTVAGLYDDATAGALRIQYGGSMKPDNAAELMGQPDIDGGLIGGAALDARSFVEIVRAAMPNGAKAL
ncbi:MAG: triose-phosphate isomerase [Verrucomicrobia bacterium]|nr:triose-phosphate isomerase [Verrucomicrobiota bacterium]